LFEYLPDNALVFAMKAMSRAADRRHVQRRLSPQITLSEYASACQAASTTGAQIRGMDAMRPQSVFVSHARPLEMQRTDGVFAEQ